MEDDGVLSQQHALVIRKELFRKSIHVCSAFIPLLLHFLYWPTIAALFLALVTYIVCEQLRLHGITVPVISMVTAAAARKRDEDKFVLGPVTLVTGILLASLMWDDISRSVGIYALAFGDGLASLAGKLMGRIKIPLAQGKTVAGSLTCFIA